jgi:hypothetical protein
MANNIFDTKAGIQAATNGRSDLELYAFYKNAVIDYYHLCKRATNSDINNRRYAKDWLKSSQPWNEKIKARLMTYADADPKNAFYRERLSYFMDVENSLKNSLYELNEDFLSGKVELTPNRLVKMLSPYFIGVNDIVEVVRLKESHIFDDPYFRPGYSKKEDSFPRNDKMTQNNRNISSNRKKKISKTKKFSHFQYNLDKMKDALLKAEKTGKFNGVNLNYGKGPNDNYTFPILELIDPVNKQEIYRKDGIIIGHPLGWMALKNNPQFISDSIEDIKRERTKLKLSAGMEDVNYINFVGRAALKYLRYLEENSIAV